MSLTSSPRPGSTPFPGQSLLGGVLTGLGGLAVSLATAAILNERLSPVTAVSEGIAEITPGKVAEAAISAVGTWDKPLLISGVVVGLLGLAALAGRSGRAPCLGRTPGVPRHGAAGARRRLGPGDAAGSAILPVVTGMITWLVVLPVLVPTGASRPSAPASPSAPPSTPASPSPGTGPGASPGTDPETSSGTGPGSGTDGWDRTTDPRPPGPPPAPPALGRRSFLQRSGVVAALSLTVGLGAQLLGRRRRLVEAARSRLRLPVTRGAVPAGAELGVTGVTPWVSPNADFYRIDTAFAIPTIDVDEWRLRIHGMVEREVTVSFADLLDAKQTEAWVTLCCVSNPVGGELIGNAWWSGVRIADLLAQAGPLPEADAVLQTSEDGWTCGTPLTALSDDRDSLLAIAMNGEPLPLEHGFPVRMVVPGLYGFVSATKWVVDLEVTRFADIEAYWTSRGWAEQAPIRTHSRIDVPGGNERAESGAMRVGGVAWSQHVGIERVEVRLDGGAWTEVEVGRGTVSQDTWVQWAGTVDVEPGVHTLAVRATDREGYTQTGVRRDVVPDGATGWHTVEFTAE